MQGYIENRLHRSYLSQQVITPDHNILLDH